MHTIKDVIRKLLDQAVQQALLDKKISVEQPALINSLPVTIEWARDPAHGDLAANLALLLAKQAKMNPRELATQLVTYLPPDPAIQRAEVAGPGFINFFLNDTVYETVIPTVLDAGKQYGRSTYGAGQRIHLEYVSANPTGPLHVGHGRGAAYGATVANLLSAIGFAVHREYYVNDAGRQMDILAVSIWLRYLDISGEAVQFPSSGYRGDYVRDIANTLYHSDGNKFKPQTPLTALLAKLPPDDDKAADNPGAAHIDALIESAKIELGDKKYTALHQAGLNAIENDIREDLAEFGVAYDGWFHESALDIDAGIAQLKQKGCVYEQDGALWFRATAFGDEKDRVLKRADGRHTYFAADVAYHWHKYQQGYDRIIDIFGADHHGYVARINAFLKALGLDETKLTIALVQFAILYRGKTRVSMSTRSGDFVTLRELREEVGNDAARFFYIMRKMSQHLDFDLELAKSRSNDNPVFYLQYAHARICSVFRQLTEEDTQANDWQLDQALTTRFTTLLNESHEKSLLQSLLRYPEWVEQAALAYEPHLLVYYLQGLATTFHSYYNAHQFLKADKALRDARLGLIAAVKQTLANGLELLGVLAPEKM